MLVGRDARLRYLGASMLLCPWVADCKTDSLPAYVGIMFNGNCLFVIHVVRSIIKEDWRGCMKPLAMRLVADYAFQRGESGEVSWIRHTNIWPPSDFGVVPDLEV